MGVADLNSVLTVENSIHHVAKATATRTDKTTAVYHLVRRLERHELDLKLLLDGWYEG